MVEEYVHDFKRTRGRDIELVDLNTREGASTATLYDIMQFPCVMVMRDDGQVIKDWQGDHLPLMSELAGYLA